MQPRATVAAQRAIEWDQAKRALAMFLMLAAPSLEIINTCAQVGSFVVFTGTAIAAMLQIGHLRASNELEAQLTEQMRRSDLQSAMRYVQTDLDRALEDPSYRAELYGLGYIDADKHPEMDACNWFNEVGTLVKNRLIDEKTFLDIFSRLVTYYWARVLPVIALGRRERDAGQYENFECLALLAQQWKAKHPTGAYPPKAARMPVIDTWLERDAALP